MLKIPCPYCGDRPEIEFSNGGEAHIARPEHPEELSNEAWSKFLFYRKSPKGIHAERWFHTHGCARWFNVLRHTITDEIETSYAIDAANPLDNK